MVGDKMKNKINIVCIIIIVIGALGLFLFK